MEDNIVYPFLDLYNIFNLYDADSINDLNQHLQKYPDYKWVLVNKDTFKIPVLQTILRNAINVNRDKIDYWLDKKPGLINSIHSFYNNFISTKNGIKKETEMGMLTLELSKEKYVDLFIRYFPIILLKLGILDDSYDETIDELINEMGWEDPKGGRFVALLLPFENNSLDVEAIEEVIDTNDDFEEQEEETPINDDPKAYHPPIEDILKDLMQKYNYEEVLKEIVALKESVDVRLSIIEEKLSTPSEDTGIDHEEITELNNQLDLQLREIEDLKNELTNKISTINELQDTIEELQEKETSEDVTAQIGVLEGEVTNLRTELDTRMETESNLRQEIDSLREQLNRVPESNNNEELLKENQELKDVIKRLNFEKNKLSTENTLLRDAVHNRKIDNDNFAPPIVEKVDEEANNNLAAQVLKANNNTPTIDENDENIKRLNRFFNNF